MPEGHLIRFGRYTLHPTEGLTIGRREVHVTQKSLAVLRLLAGRAGQVVTKDELFRSVWPETAVTDAALTSCIQELRQALGDDARAPTFIETRHRRGFRFLVPVTLASAAAWGTSADGPSAGADALVGRDDALGVLALALDRAGAGARQVVVVTGEPGIGKTSLVDGFIARLDQSPGIEVARGACVERFGAGEAYQPLLEALTRLCRQDGGERYRANLRQHAPTWLAQLPALQTAAEYRALQRRTAGVTRERMQRELNDCLEAIASGTTLVLVLDDLHWSDLSTLDWMAGFAHRQDPARVLLVTTCRQGSNHPFDAVSAALRLKPWCHHLELTGLGNAATLELVARRSRLDPDRARRLSGRIHAQTEGHPLFITVMLDDLHARGVLPAADDPGTADSLADVDLDVPDNLRRLIERQIDQLEPFERELLEVASVAGGEWSSAEAAAGTKRPQAEADVALADLARRHVFIRRAGTVEWPDGTLAECYAFVHALHGDVLRDRLPAGRRAALHRAVGERLETAFAGGTEDRAAQLAVHFREARDIDQAIVYLKLAGRAASRRGAAEDARRHLTDAIALLKTTPASPRQDEREVDLQVALGSVLMAAHGWGAPEVERAYDRARQLCAGLEKTPQLFPSVWGLWLFRWGRGDLDAARQLADTLDQLAAGSPDPALKLQRHHALWATAFSAGELDTVRLHASEGLSHVEAGEPAEQVSSYGNHDAAVCGQLFAARALAMQGRIEEALRASSAATDRARRLEHPFTLALALVFGGAVHQLRREPQAARACALEAVALASRHGFALLRAWGAAIEGWSLAESGTTPHAADKIEQALSSAGATGSHQFETYLLALLAETHLKSAAFAAGLEAVERGLARARESGERFHEPELHRLHGVLLQATGARAEAGAALQLALDTAGAQGARLFTLRAAVSLGGLWLSDGRQDAARALVTDALKGMPEVPGSADAADAQLIAELS